MSERDPVVNNLGYGSGRRRPRRLFRPRVVAGPYCECGNCDSTGRNGGPEVILPRAAWAVAGHGELNALAVHPDHIEPFLNDHVVTVYPAGWAAVRPPRLSSLLGPPRPQRSTRMTRITELEALTVGPDEVLIIRLPGPPPVDDPAFDQKMGEAEGVLDGILEALRNVGLVGRSLILTGSEIEFTKVKLSDELVRQVAAAMQTPARPAPVTPAEDADTRGSA